MHRGWYASGMKFDESIAASDRKRRVVSLVGAMLLSATSVSLLVILWASIASLSLHLLRTMPTPAIWVLSHFASMLPMLTVLLIIPFSWTVARKRRSNSMRK